MRIAIVNDALIAIDALRRSIVREGRHQIAWIAQDGEEAVARCLKDKPDLILMDLFMPRVDGIEATRRIMAQKPCAIIVATANVSNHPAKVFEAMGAGALDAVSIPMWGESETLDGGKSLHSKIENIQRLIREPSKAAKSSANLNNTSSTGAARDQKIVAIGASAGGPTAVTTILSALPENFPAGIVIVQHVDKQFASGLTAWFGNHTKLRVRVAEEGDHPEPGSVLLAGRDKHLVFSAPNRMSYSVQPTECSYRPSVDVFFRSVAKHWPGKAVGVLLTGMGRDGAEGLKTLREHGHHTISQDKGSSAVYGMPKAAAELNAATEILALDKIAPRLTNMFKADVRRTS
ncbi:MAG: chemotaxis response regulator protein-glutamate methylesterase [Verrucomicrobia bacterium]|nr:chemotaxis response regulator protein-glutamate methylesterase [Verrucomicrobiota bacterium]